MGNGEDYKTDPRYWTQFDESVETLHIEKLVLPDNKEEEERVKSLLKKTVDRDSALICYMWYDVYHFLKTGYEVNIKTFKTNNFDELMANCTNLDSNQNLSIFEFKECNDNSFKQAELLMKQVGLIAVVVNNNLDKQYRLNYIYKKS